MGFAININGLLGGLVASSRYRYLRMGEREMGGDDEWDSAISCTVSYVNYGSLDAVTFTGETVRSWCDIPTAAELVKHCRWCIRELPCTPAEETVHWFLTGLSPAKQLIAQL